MDWKTIRNELRKVSALVDGWSQRDEEIPAVERDLALEKLRNLYEAIRFADSGNLTDGESEAGVSDGETLPESIDLGKVLSLDGFPDLDEPTGPIFVEPAAPLAAEETSQDGEAARAGESGHAGEAAVAEHPAADTESGPTQPIAETVAETVAESVAEAAVSLDTPSEPVAGSEPVRQRHGSPTLFGLEDEEDLRHRHKQRVIMSLYDPSPMEERESVFARRAEARRASGAVHPQEEPTIDVVEPTGPAVAPQESLPDGNPESGAASVPVGEPEMTAAAAASESESEQPVAASASVETAPGSGKSPEEELPAVSEAEPSAASEEDASQETVSEEGASEEGASADETPETAEAAAVEHPAEAGNVADEVDAGSQAASRTETGDKTGGEAETPAEPAANAAATEPSGTVESVASAESAGTAAGATSAAGSVGTKTAASAATSTVASEPSASAAPAGEPVDDSAIDVDSAFEELTIETLSDTDSAGNEPARSGKHGWTESGRDPFAGMQSLQGGAVLGEVINHDVQTLADTITPPRDMASELRRSEPIGDLRQAIGLNDKFLLIRDLFGGDAAAYERALDRLNRFDDLDDCMIFIAEHYAWNPNSDGAKLLMELLERKFA